MRRWHENSLRARAASLPRQGQRVVQADRPDTRIERHAASLNSQIQQPGAFFQAERRVLAGSGKQGDSAHAGGTQAVDQFERGAKVKLTLFAARGEGGNNDTVVFSHSVNAVRQRRS